MIGHFELKFSLLDAKTFNVAKQIVVTGGFMVS